MSILPSSIPDCSYVKGNLGENINLLMGELRTSDNIVYTIPPQVIEELNRNVGISSSFYKFLCKKNPSLWEENFKELYNHYYQGNITFLVSEGEIISYTLAERLPLLNSQFFSVADSMLSDYTNEIEVASSSYSVETATANFCVLSKQEFLKGEEVYRVGVLLLNSEVGTVTCQLVVLEGEDKWYYLPSKYYNLSAARYNRSTKDSEEAFKVLLLRVISDVLSKEYLSGKVDDFFCHKQVCKHVNLTYEEFRYVLRTLRRAAVNSDMDESEQETLLDNLSDYHGDFEKNYPLLEDQEASYIWRCSAVSDYSIMMLIDKIQDILRCHVFYEESLMELKNLLGAFVINDKIATELAKRKV